MLRLFSPILLLSVIVALASCASGKKDKPEIEIDPGMVPVTDSPTEGSVLKLAQVESVKAEISPTQPGEANVVIHGLLHDGATQIHDVQQQRLADGFILTVITARPRNAVATLALIPFERTVTLKLEGMPKGPCKIVVNGVATTVTVP